MGAGIRLTKYIENKGFTKKSFCEKFGFNYNNMVNVFADKREIGMILLNQIKTALPDLSTDWLLYGKGNPEILNYSEKRVEMINEVNEEVNPTYLKDEFEKLLLKYLDKDSIKQKINEITRRN